MAKPNRPAPVFGSFHIIETEDGVVEYAALAPTREALEEQIKERSKSPRQDKAWNKEPEVEASLQSEYGKEIWSAFRQVYSYYYLAVYITDIIPLVARSRFSKDVVDYAKSHYSKVGDLEGFPLYEMDQSDAASMDDKINRIEDFDRGAKKLKYSILLSLVSTFDNAFAQLCKFLMKKEPDRYTGSDRTYTVSEILSLKSIDEIVDRVITDEIEQIMNKSHSDQLSFFSKNFHVNIDGYPRMPEYLEIFERRNLAAHGDLIVNHRYVENCTRAKLASCPDIGSKLEITEDYVTNSIDILIEVIIILGFSVWRKRCPDETDTAFGTVLALSFELLKDKRSAVATRVVEYALGIADAKCHLQTRQMLTVNKAIGLKMSGRAEEASELLEATDWSACSPLMKLGVASVRGDVIEAIRHLEGAKVVDDVDVVQLNEWPVFQWVREKEEFATKVEEIFGTPLRKSLELTVSDREEPNSAGDAP